MLVAFPCSDVKLDVLFIYLLRNVFIREHDNAFHAQLWRFLQFLIRQVRSNIGAVLGVLLVLRMEVVEGVRHYVLGIHCLLEAAGDRLHGEGAVRVAVRVHVHGGRERVPQRHRRGAHLDADQEVLVAGRHSTGCRGNVARIQYRGDHLRLLEYGQGDALPERKEDDRFNGEELQNRIERLQHLPGGSEEEEQTVECQAHGEIIDDRYVNVAAVGTPVAVVVMPESLQENDDESAKRLYEAELQGCLLAETEEADRVRCSCQATRAVDAGRAHRPPAQLRHYVPFAPEVLVAQGQEAIDHERFITIPDGEEVHVVRVSIEEEQRYPAVTAVYWDDKQDSHDPTLL